MKLILVLMLIALGIFFYQTNFKEFFISNLQVSEQKEIENVKAEDTSQIQKTSPPSPNLTLNTPPSQKLLQNSYHIFQTFNNCGPASLSMALSYYGLNVSQQKLGRQLRPWQNPQGINDDKSVTLDEMAEKSKEYGFIPYHRPNGNAETIKFFLANDMPVITRTTTKENEDIGHYRIVKGYDDTTGEFIQDDSLQGKNLKFSYDAFNKIWKKFNYEYLVLVPKDKLKIAKVILSEDKDVKASWAKAAENARKELTNNPDDIYALFNLSVALYNTGDYQGSVTEYEKVENRLPFRTLWYQIEPIQAYLEKSNYDKVFSITDQIFSNQNLANSEAYILRGKSYLKQGNIDAARQEFEKAVYYNQNLKSAQEALKSIENI